MPNSPARLESPRIAGILNVTRDSFSDGGRYFDSEAAVAHGLALRAAGACVVDVGAESTHPDAEDVTEAEELRRLKPVVRALVAERVEVSVDTHRPNVMREVLAWGASMINDVSGATDPRTAEIVAAANARIVIMYSRSSAPRAARVETEVATLIDDLVETLADRVARVVSEGVPRERIIVDPGMGFFLSSAPRASLRVLARLDSIRTRLGIPLMVSASRKSFLGGVADQEDPRDRAAATLAAELAAWRNGATWVRTHDVRALVDAVRVWQAIDAERA